ncbi:metal ABC transporter permease [Microvirga massiliensis]|uniref:metal ABC transporter permease n=1 Tax=Microvirga massiliensis TaxID=1033741 RepID=UPI00065F74EA|nr:metal ABC transporter permease [Microvirga massiliensis]
MLELLFWPFVAGLVLTGIHAYFGLHVLARGVIFVDLSLAQLAALGLAAALLAGHSVQSEAGYWYAFAFATGGAVLFALARPYEKLVPQEAVIGMVYAVSASLGVMALDRAPQGTEHIKQLLIGSILTVTPQEVGQLAVLYGAIGLVHVVFRQALVEVSFHPGLAAERRRRIFLWDVVFYGSFALVVTSSVRIAGVLLVFSYLIVPAALAGLLTAGLLRRLVLAWLLGAALTSAGLYASWTWDLPTGPAIVTAFGAAIALVALGFATRKLTARTAGRIACGVAVVAGLLLLAFPHMDQPWLDALEDVAPPLQTAFLASGERMTRDSALEAIERARADLARLRALEQDVRWGKVAMEPERAEQLRQYLAGRSEISAGDQLVLQHLRGKARERQRFGLGLPLLLLGAAGFYGLRRTRPR